MTFRLKLSRKKRNKRPLFSPENRRSLQPDAIINRLKRKGFSPSLLACIPLTAVIIALWAGAAAAQEAELSPEYVQGALNTIWVLVATILVVFMNAGFGMLEVGLCRTKNAVNILSKNLIVFALATMAFWAIGFSIAFGGDNPFIGGGGWFLSSTDPGTYGLDPFPAGLPIPVFFFFQSAFVATAATIVSGAVAERIEFTAFLIFSLLLTGISYPITAHWVWSGSGWLAGLGFSDFAGSTVVHAMGGWAALMGSAILGPRIGKYDENGQVRPIPGHNLGFATLGCLILWICWFGFNPGSQLAADEAVPYIALTTNLSGCAGGITATLTSWLRDGKPDLSMVINGILAGLVGVTAGCNVVSYLGAAIIGAIAGVLVVYAVSFFDKIKVDDPVGAISVHLVNGTWGTIAVGIFADPNIPIAGEDALRGLFTGNPMQLFIQILGVLSVGGFTVLMSTIFWFALKATVGIRVSPEHEYEGLDIAEHGMEAYTGFVTQDPGSFASNIASGSPGSEKHH